MKNNKVIINPPIKNKDEEFDNTVGGLNWLNASNEHPKNPKSGDSYWNPKIEKGFTYNGKEWIEFI